MQIVEFLKKLIWIAAIIFWIYAGFQLIIVQWEEDAINKSKRQLRWSIIAIILIYLAEPLLRNVFFWWWIFAPWEAILNPEAAKIWAKEIEWIVSYLQTFIALIAIFMIITVWFKTVFSLDKEEALENQKKTILWIWIWAILIFINKILVYYWISWNPITWEERNFAKVIEEFSWIIKYFLWFVWAIAFLLLIYWGFLLITARWEDDQITTWKNIFINVILWIFIIAVSYVIISTIILSSK